MIDYHFSKGTSKHLTSYYLSLFSSCHWLSSISPLLFLYIFFNASTRYILHPPLIPPLKAIIKKNLTIRQYPFPIPVFCLSFIRAHKLFKKDPANGSREEIITYINLPLYFDSIWACKIFKPGTTIAGNVLDRTRGGGLFLVTFISLPWLISSAAAALKEKQ